MKKKQIETSLIHGGRAEGNERRALAPPIHMSSSFSFASIEDAEKVMAFESSDYVYTRGNNPTLRLFENRMAELEGGAGAVAFSSGMAAISTVLFSLLTPGDAAVLHKTVYGSTHTVMTKLLPRYGMESFSIDLSKTDALKHLLESAQGKRVKVIFFETPANPTLTLIDIQAVSQTAEKYGVTVVVDNTLATPYLQNPLALGADIVVHSATKYICGHGDALGGVAVAKDENYLFSLKFDYMCDFGGVMSPFNGWLMLRGLKSLGVRMDRHCDNGENVAQFLAAHPRIAKVHYPGLAAHPNRQLIPSQMRKAGAMISFELGGTLKEAKQVINRLNLIKTAVSLGDCETLIQLPAAMTHRGYDHKRLEAFGLTETMLRLSIGLEHTDDLIADLEYALN